MYLFVTDDEAVILYFLALLLSHSFSTSQMHTSPEELAEEGILKKKKIKRVKLEGIKVNMVNIKGAPKGKVVCELIVTAAATDAKSSHSLKDSESKSDEAVLLAADEEVSLRISKYFVLLIHLFTQELESWVKAIAQATDNPFEQLLNDKRAMEKKKSGTLSAPSSVRVV